MNSRYIFLFLIVFSIPRFTLAQSPVYLTAVNEHVRRSKPFVEEPATIDATLTKARQRKQLMAYLKEAQTGDINYNSAKVRRLYYMASLFTHLRLYPLAMKCFLKTMRPGVDSISKNDLPITTNDDSLVAKDEHINDDQEIKSKPISNEKIIQTFNDDKTAVAYAMIFHVKQPVRGKKQIYKLANTGHTFITLIKYNSDSTYAAISFGFYPKKDNPLSATPIFPTTSSTFKDDSEHAWDEVLGKFISKRRFNKILALTQQYHNISYNLSKNNCTDFGLKAAALAGLDVWETKGNWPLGSGNNPGVTGQSLLEGKFDNADTGDQRNLLISNQN